MSTAGPTLEVMWKEVQGLLNAEIQRLPAKYRAPFVLCWLEGKSRAEAARELRLKEGTLSSRLDRARQKLQHRLTKRGIELSSLGGLAALWSQGGETVSARLLETTVQASLQFAAGPGTAVGIFSTPVVTLLEEVVRGMVMNKFKAGIPLILVIAIIGAATGLLAYTKVPAPTQESREAEPDNPPAVEKEKPKSDKERLQGTWLQISLELDGNRQDLSSDNRTVFFEGDNLVLNYPGAWPTVVTCKYALKPGQKPKAIDRIDRAGDTLGIYLLEGDRLTICWAKKPKDRRPKEFVTKQNSEFLVEVFKRLPDEENSVGTETWNKEAVLRFPYRPTSVSFGPDGKTLVIAGFDDGFGAILGTDGGPGHTTLWDLSQQKEKATFARGADMYFSEVSPDANLLATEHQLGEKKWFGGIALWDIARGKTRSTFGDSESGVRALAFSRDGKILAAGYYNGRARLFDLSGKDKTDEIPGIPKAQESGVTCLAFSPDSKFLATGGYDASITLWELGTGKSLGTLRGHRERLIAVTYSPDGKLLSSVSGDGAVKVWDLSILKAKTTLQGIREVRALAFAPDGRTLAFCGFEMEKETILVKLIDPMAGKEKATIKPRMDCPKALAFSPDGKRLALAGELAGGKMVIGDQGLVILWKLEKIGN